MTNKNQQNNNTSKISVLTHRGLDAGKQDYFAESSREAFTDQLTRGFGLEFDLQFTKDEEIVVLHDSTLTRITKGIDTRKINEVSSEVLLALNMNDCHVMTFSSLLALIATHNNASINAIHIKSLWQDTKHLDLILSQLEGIDPQKFVLFDLKIESAQYIKQKNSKLQLAASVSHPYDIERFNNVVGGTLLSIEEVLPNKTIYDWVWLDEWDRQDAEGTRKELYTKQTFETLTTAGFTIALVTPELHGTSPGLLGSESHEDAKTQDSRKKRFQEIISLNPNAVCTDNPDLITSLIQQHVS